MTAPTNYSMSDYRNEAGDKARDIAGQVADKAADLASQAGNKIDEALGGASELVKAAADKGREASAQAEEVASNFKRALDRSVKEQPMTTLALAALAGVAVGALWKS